MMTDNLDHMRELIRMASADPKFFDRLDTAALQKAIAAAVGIPDDIMRDLSAIPEPPALAPDYSDLIEEAIRGHSG